MKHICEYNTFDPNKSYVTLLRTMTKKSIIGFGKYKDYRVGDIINLGELEYLRWVYYNSELVTFMDDILDEIGITEEYRIKKPGKQPEKFRKLNGDIIKNMTDLERIKFIAHRNKTIKNTELTKIITNKKIDNRKFSKISMRDRNHGVKKT